PFIRLILLMISTSLIPWISMVSVISIHDTPANKYMSAALRAVFLFLSIFCMTTFPDKSQLFNTGIKSSNLFNGQSEEYGGPLVLLAFDPNSAAMPLDDLLHRDQPY